MTENVGIGILKESKKVSTKEIKIKRRYTIMVSFINSFLIYFIQLLVICVVAGVGLTIGLTMAKKKNAGNTSETESAEGAGKA